MGSHSARHRSTRARPAASEERATALLTRLGVAPHAATPRSTTKPVRHDGRPRSGPVDPTPSPVGYRDGGTRRVRSGPAVDGWPVNPLGVPLHGSSTGRDDTVADAAARCHTAVDAAGRDHAADSAPARRAGRHAALDPTEAAAPSATATATPTTAASTSTSDQREGGRHRAGAATAVEPVPVTPTDSSGSPRAVSPANAASPAAAAVGRLDAPGRRRTAAPADAAPPPSSAPVTHPAARPDRRTVAPGDETAPWLAPVIPLDAPGRGRAVVQLDDTAPWLVPVRRTPGALFTPTTAQEIGGVAETATDPPVDAPDATDLDAADAGSTDLRVSGPGVSDRGVSGSGVWGPSATELDVTDLDGSGPDATGTAPLPTPARRPAGATETAIPRIRLAIRQALAAGGGAPAGLAADGRDAVRLASDTCPLSRTPTLATFRLSRRTQPVVAALSVTAVGASAMLAATTLSERPPQAPSLDAVAAFGATPAKADAPGALSFALPAAHPSATPTAANPASTLTSAPPTVQASAIVAQAKADAQATAGHASPTVAPTAPPTHHSTAPTATPTATPAPTAVRQPVSPQATPAPTPAPATPTPAPATPTPAPAPTVRANGSAAAPAAGSTVGTRALAIARTAMGRPYVWGAVGPHAFDCSGLVVWAFRQVGVSLPHSSAAQSTRGAPVTYANLQPGDLVFFYSPVSHVGIYAGNGMVLNATESGEPVQLTRLAYMPFHNARRVSA